MILHRPGADPYTYYKMHHVSRALAAASLSEEFGLYEAMRGGPGDPADIAARAGLPERSTRVLLSCNACIGVVGVEDDQWFIHEIMREFVLEGGRNHRRMRTPEDRGYYDAARLAIPRGQAVPEELPQWETDPEGDDDTTAFSPGRDGWRILWGEALAEAFDFGPYHQVADLGGATGGVLVGLTGMRPHLKGVVVDLPYSQGSAEQAITASGAGDRVRFHAADFFRDPLPDGTDAVFMSHIVHDWDDEHCLSLLGNTRQDLPSGAPVIVQEFLLDEDKTGPLLAVFQWFGVFATTRGGEQRTGSEISSLMEEAGLVRPEVRRVDHEQSLVIGWRA